MDYGIIMIMIGKENDIMMVRMEVFWGNPSSLAANESPIFPSRSIQEAGDLPDKYEVTMASWDGVPLSGPVR